MNSTRHRRALTTVVFWDIYGFSLLCDILKDSLDSVADFLQDYYRTALDVVHNHNGEVDKYIGDGVMATFNLSGGDDIDGTNEDAISAVSAALDFREAFEYYLDWYWHEEWKSKTNEPIEFGLKCGISTGNVIYFIVGTEGKATAVGPTVNLASRFAGLANKNNDILISQTTETRVGTELFEIDNEISVETLQHQKSLGGVKICFPVRGIYSMEGSSGC